MKKLCNLLCINLLLSGLAFNAIAIELTDLSSEEKGLAIANEIDRRDHGYGNFTADMKMVLRDRKGDESTRIIRNQTLEMENDGDKTMSIFDEPPDIRGTISLTYSHGKDPDDQWIFFPSLKRVKRINTKNKSGSFMGSEFAYEDIGSQEVNKYSYNFSHEERLDSKDCYVIERKPAYEFSGYTRQLVWVDKKEFIPLKILFYDRKNSLLKTLWFKNYQQYLKQYWRAGEMHVENHQTHKSTTLYWNNYQFKVNLTERDFSQSALRRAR